MAEVTLAGLLSSAEWAISIRETAEENANAAWKLWEIALDAKVRARDAERKALAALDSKTEATAEARAARDAEAQAVQHKAAAEAEHEQKHVSLSFDRDLLMASHWLIRAVSRNEIGYGSGLSPYKYGAEFTCGEAYFINALRALVSDVVERSR